MKSMPNKRRFAGLLIATLLTAVSLAAQPKYEVFAIRYGTLKDFKMSGLVAGADPARRMDIALLFWLVKGEGRNIRRLRLLSRSVHEPVEAGRLRKALGRN